MLLFNVKGSLCVVWCPAINKLESANLCSHIYPHDTARADIESKSSARLRVCVCVCAVKQLIESKIKVCLHNICVCCVYLLCTVGYMYTHVHL